MDQTTKAILDKTMAEAVGNADVTKAVFGRLLATGTFEPIHDWFVSELEAYNHADALNAVIKFSVMIMSEAMIQSKPGREEKIGKIMLELFTGYVEPMVKSTQLYRATGGKP